MKNKILFVPRTNKSSTNGKKIWLQFNNNNSEKKIEEITQKANAVNEFWLIEILTGRSRSVCLVALNVFGVCVCVPACACVCIIYLFSLLNA